MTAGEGELVRRARVGDVVRYLLTQEDADAINRRRTDAEHFGAGDGRTGYIVHAGNPVAPGMEFPAIVVRAWPARQVNAQVLLDGTDALWVTSKVEGPGYGQWHWPRRID